MAFSSTPPCTGRRRRSSPSFGTRVRYSGASVGYQLAGVLGGSVAPLISVALLAAFDSWVPIAIYVVAALLFTFAALWAAPETSHVALEEAERVEEEIGTQEGQPAPAPRPS